jgi:hypothetical protein
MHTQLFELMELYHGMNETQRLGLEEHAWHGNDTTVEFFLLHSGLLSSTLNLVDLVELIPQKLLGEHITYHRDIPKAKPHHKISGNFRDFLDEIHELIEFDKSRGFYEKEEDIKHL